MEDRKNGYTFTDRRDRAGAAEQGRNPEAPSPERQGDSPDWTRQARDVDFSTLIVSLASAALISMGRVPDPATGQTGMDLAVAKQNIDIIAMLQEKARGNLTPEEEKLVENVLYDLRMNYVETQRR